MVVFRYYCGSCCKYIEDEQCDSCGEDAEVEEVTSEYLSKEHILNVLNEHWGKNAIDGNYQTLLNKFALLELLQSKESPEIAKRGDE